MALVTTPEAAFADVPDYDYTHERVPVRDDGAEMAYVDVPGEGDETFLLLHGEPTWGFLYRSFIPTLSGRGRVVVPDMLGFGRSDKYTDPGAYTFEMLYESYERLVLDELDLMGVTLVCQDWGEILGLALAAHNPDRFDRLVAMNTGVPDGTQTMSDAWHQFEQFVSSVETLPLDMLVENATSTELSEEVLAAYEPPSTPRMRKPARERCPVSFQPRQTTPAQSECGPRASASPSGRNPRSCCSPRTTQSRATPATRYES